MKTCAGVERERWLRLVPEGAREVRVGETDGVCTIAMTTTAAADALRSFAERAVVTGGYVLTANRSDDAGTTLRFRGAGVGGEARVEVGPPAALTWTLRTE